jgi:hypothetical protein
MNAVADIFSGKCKNKNRIVNDIFLSTIFI